MCSSRRFDTSDACPMARHMASDMGGCSYGGATGSLVGGSDPYIYYQLDYTVRPVLGTVFNIYTCTLFTCAFLYIYINYII